MFKHSVPLSIITVALTAVTASTVIAAAPVLHPAFSPSKAQMRAAFSSMEQRHRAENTGDRGTSPTFGVRRTVSIPVSSSFVEHTPLILTVTLLTPLEGCRRRGYEFGGLHGRTASDREEMLESALRLMGKPITFEAVLDTQGLSEEDNVTFPEITMSLVQESGPPSSPQQPPSFHLGGGRDLFSGDVPVEVTFPLLAPDTQTPYPTSRMTRLILIVTVGTTEQRLDYPLQAIVGKDVTRKM